MNEKEKNRFSFFVDFVISRVKTDTGYAAALRRADNPSTAPMAWEYLVPWCDISIDRERMAFSIVAAAIARQKPDSDGSADMGQLLRSIVISGDDDSEKRRLQRLLACDSTLDICEVIRPILKYVQGKAAMAIDYSRLLEDLLFWDERKRLSWARSFFHGKQDEQEA